MRTSLFSPSCTRTLATAAAAVVATYSLHASMPPGPLALPFEDKVQAGLFLPQGWAFFTKTPRTPEVFVLDLAQGGDRPLYPVKFSHSSPAGLFREARSVGPEVGLLLDRLPATAWSDCDRPVGLCLAERAVAVQPTVVKNTSLRRTVCGQVGFAQRQRVPWALRQQAVPRDMPSVVAVADVRC